jgi:hypothetical protein
MKKPRFKVWFWNYPEMKIAAVNKKEAASIAIHRARQDKSLTWFQRQDLEVSAVDQL